MRYYISDLHFYHAALNERMDNRGFESVEAMNEYMISKWNTRVKSKKDEVVIPGDFCMSRFGKDANELLKRLNGRKILIKGNHERFLKDKHPLSLEECILYDYNEGIKQIDWDTMEKVGTDSYSRNVKMAECLSPKAISASLIQCVYVPDEWTKEYVEQLFWDRGIREQPPYVSVMEKFF